MCNRYRVLISCHPQRETHCISKGGFVISTYLMSWTSIKLHLLKLHNSLYILNVEVWCIEFSRGILSLNLSLFREHICCTLTTGKYLYYLSFTVYSHWYNTVCDDVPVDSSNMCAIWECTLPLKQSSRAHSKSKVLIVFRQLTCVCLSVETMVQLHLNIQSAYCTRKQASGSIALWSQTHVRIN